MSLSARDTDHKAEPFTYAPLNLSQCSIRLLRINPDLSSSGYVRCDIRDATVDDDYTCLSYVWGQPDNGYPVVINEQLHRVRRNLLDSLQHAKKKGFGWLWIDALWIDQENLAERTHQVQQMGHIYLLDTYRAQQCQVLHNHVFSLLGLCGEGSDLVVDYEASVEELLWRTCNSCAFCLCSLKIVSRALFRYHEKRWSIAQSISSFTLLRMRYAEVRTENGDRNEGFTFFANPGPLDVSKFARMNEVFLNRRQTAVYTASYFVPMSWICNKHKRKGSWFLALCVSTDGAGFDHYYLPAEMNVFRDDALDSELPDEALKFEVRHWPDDLEVIYHKPRLCTIRLSLAFWVELSESDAWADSSGWGYCNRATEERGGLKLSIM